MVTDLVDLTKQHARSTAFQDELTRLVLPEAEQHGSTAHKERGIRLRVRIGLHAPDEISKREDKPDNERDQDTKKDDTESIVVRMDFDEEAFKLNLKRPEPLEYQVERRNEAKHRVKTGLWQPRNPGSFLSMDRKATKLQARKIQR